MKRGARALAATLALGALVALAGCANVPPYAPPAVRVPPPQAGPTTMPPAVATNAPRVTATAPDTVPSRAAEEVLGTIPEPLKAEERVPPPSSPSGAGVAGAFVPAEPDSSGAVAEPDSARAGIPVPAPVPVLGDRPSPEIVTTPDTLSHAASAPTVPPAATSRRSPATPAAGPDTCWRVQVAAPAERAKAERYLAAAQSQLLVPMVIEKDRGLCKVRTRDCLGGPAADALRRRALQAGFEGAFRFQGRRP
jgi:hypothetical protein